MQRVEKSHLGQDAQLQKDQRQDRAQSGRETERGLGKVE